MTGPHRHKHKPAGEPVSLAFIQERTTLDPASGFWIWTGAISRHGYGVVRNGAKTTRAHRLAFQLATGQALPSSVDVCHRCDVRACANPAHLFAGSRADNMRDCASKGRIRAPVLAGDASPNSKLTSAQVRAIREDPRSNRSLASAYSVDSGTISCIRRGLTWRGV